jgi:hypothetical protein
MKNIFSLLLVALIFSTPTFAQDTDNDAITIKIPLFAHPTIRLTGALITPTDANFKGNWGESALKYDGALNSLKTNYGVELGYSKDKSYFPNADKWDIEYLFFKYSNADYTIAQLEEYNNCLENYTHSAISFNYLADREEDNLPLYNFSSIMSVGISSVEGAGYKFSKHNGIRLLTGGAMNWYFVKLDGPILYEDVMLRIDPINMEHLADGFRFGHSFMSEVNLNVYNGISVFANVKEDLIYPRVVFWKYTGSMICYGIADGILGTFTRHIKYKSPYAYPVVNFVLQTALKWGFTELSRKNMNWPFETASPVILESFNIGIQYEF